MDTATISLTIAIAVLYLTLGYLLARPHLKRTRCMHCGSKLTVTTKTQMNDVRNEKRNGYTGHRTYFCIPEWKQYTVGIFRHASQYRPARRKFPRAA